MAIPEMKKFDPNRFVIAQFPFRGKIGPLSISERKRISSLTGDLKATLFAQALKPTFVKYTDDDRARLSTLMERAQVFSSLNVPKSFESDPWGDCKDAWDPRLAANLALMMGKFYGKTDGLKVLQIACHWGPMLSFLKQEINAEVHGLDVNPRAAEFAASRGMNFIRTGTVQNMPFNTAEFDIVISRHILCDDYAFVFYPWATREEYENVVLSECHKNRDIVLSHLLRILSEASRILKPGGRMFSLNEELVTVTTASPFFSEYRVIDSEHIVLTK